MFPSRWPVKDLPVSERLFTYEELATTLSRPPEAVRQLAKRKRWRRTLGNDGKARIAVPADYLDLPRPPRAIACES